ncbi:Isopiperitenol dehydrogenase [Bertholletia excelsa]
MAHSSLIKKLEGKVAIVTGGASGIGEATACLFAQHGARAIVIADIQDAKGQQVAESIGSGQCSYIHCDVTEEAQVQAMVDWTVRSYGQLDIMFSNAGILFGDPDQVILDLDLSKADRLFSTNVRGMAACVKHAARAMVEGHVRGSIVCTTSIAATKGYMKWTDYIMSKHAILGLVRAACQQLGGYGIRVNCVSPSLVATPLVLNAENKDAGEIEKESEALAPLKGIVLRTKHVADAVLFLACDESAYVSGHNLVVDGGNDTNL